MSILLSLAVNLLLLISIVFVSDKTLSKKYSSLTFLPLLLLLAPLLHYTPPQPTFYFFPFATLLILPLVTKNRLWSVVLGCVYILLASLFVSGIIALSFYFQVDHTILSDKHILDSILQHQHDALYLPFRLRPILFNRLVYIYVLLAHTVDFLSPASLYSVLLLANLYPLTLGLISLIKYRLSSEKLFILGGIAINLLVIGFSRSTPSLATFFIVSPLISYLILIGLKDVNTRIYLTLLIISLAIQLNSL